MSSQAAIGTGNLAFDQVQIASDFNKVLALGWVRMQSGRVRSSQMMERPGESPSIVENRRYRQLAFQDDLYYRPPVRVDTLGGNADEDGKTRLRFDGTRLLPAAELSK
ncbi:hypothetical protein HJC02_16920 [Rhizobium sp. NLR4a]|uniref:hypothetical protein n=1 Tax=Rhizobium sp. NLR4a TaxID=2731117 RepID=UPI001C838885|nr:hypothetical protein [Rhizobium sp. NLR4a]MBX5233933.1 hypothetical protein [Rhizobium sp. NLR4a]